MVGNKEEQCYTCNHRKQLLPFLKVTMLRPVFFVLHHNFA